MGKDFGMKKESEKPQEELSEFDKVMRGLIAVPKAELVEAEEQHRERMKKLREHREGRK